MDGSSTVGAFEAERVLDHDLGLHDRIAATRHVPKQIAAAQAAVAPRRAGSPARRGAPIFSRSDERPRRDEPLGVELELHGDVVSGQPLSPSEIAAKRHRALEEPHPERGGEHGEDETDGDRVEDLRAERPRGQVDPAAQGEDPAAAVREHV